MPVPSAARRKSGPWRRPDGGEYAYFFCFYPSDLAAINMDPDGTTHIGKYFFNHSFMVPGLIGVTVATAAAYLLSRVLL